MKPVKLFSAKFFTIYLCYACVCVCLIVDFNAFRMELNLMKLISLNKIIINKYLLFRLEPTTTDKNLKNTHTHN